MIFNKTKPSLIVAILLMAISIITFSCGSGNVLYLGYLNPNKTENQNELNTDYLETRKGEKIIGKVTIKNRKAFVGDRSFPLNEIKGYTSEQNYYYWYITSPTSELGIFLKRIVHGKINVYYRHYVREASQTGNNMRQDIYQQYLQIGNEGKLTILGSTKTLQDAVKDCPEAAQMANKTNAELTAAIKENRNYVNEIFEIYNNCK